VVIHCWQEGAVWTCDLGSDGLPGGWTGCDCDLKVPVGWMAKDVMLVELLTDWGWAYDVTLIYVVRGPLTAGRVCERHDGWACG